MPSWRNIGYKGKKFNPASKQQAAAVAGRAARNAVLSTRRIPSGPSGGPRGFYGPWNRPRGLGPELKVIDILQNDYGVIATTLQVTTLNAVATGNDYNTRTGRRANMKSVNIRGQIFADPTASTPKGDVIRILVFHDAQPNGVLPTGAMLLTEDKNTSFNNLSNRDRFRVLYDKTINVDGVLFTAGALTNGSPKQYGFKIFKKLNLETTYSGTGGTIAEIATGGLFFGIISKQAQSWSLLMNTRVRFTDP